MAKKTVAELTEMVEELRAEIESIKESMNTSPPIQWVQEVPVRTVDNSPDYFTKLVSETLAPYAFYREEGDVWKYHGYL